jgi:DNA-binding CsgD family transcriptional regulator
VERLDASDLARVGRFVAETGEVDGDGPFPPAFLAALRRLVPCDFVGFNELDRVRERHLGFVVYPLGATDGMEAPITYWQARASHPLCWYHETTGDWRAHRLSDFVTLRELRRSSVYYEWVLPVGQKHLLTVGLDAPLDHTKVFQFNRPDGPDFDERDCLVLDVLRPLFAARYAWWLTRQNPPEARSATVEVALTPREHEVLALVAEGLTNGEIAQRLWISAGTVRRHLENAYGKLGVHTRTAAVRAASLDA